VKRSDASGFTAVGFRSGGIEPGIILIAEGTPMPDSMRLEGPSNSDGWRLMERVEDGEFERRINRAGWIFYLMAGEIKATVFGFDRGKALRAAIGRIIASVRFQRCNSLQITEVTAKSFLKLPYVKVSARSRHIQEQPLDRPLFDGQ